MPPIQNEFVMSSSSFELHNQCFTYILGSIGKKVQIFLMLSWDASQGNKADDTLIVCHMECFRCVLCGDLAGRAGLIFLTILMLFKLIGLQKT